MISFKNIQVNILFYITLNFYIALHLLLSRYHFCFLWFLSFDEHDNIELYGVCLFMCVVQLFLIEVHIYRFCEFQLLYFPSIYNFFPLKLLYYDLVPRLPQQVSILFHIWNYYHYFRKFAIALKYLLQNLSIV